MKHGDIFGVGTVALCGWVRADPWHQQQERQHHKVDAACGKLMLELGYVAAYTLTALLAQLLPNVSETICQEKRASRKIHPLWIRSDNIVFVWRVGCFARFGYLFK